MGTGFYVSGGATTQTDTSSTTRTQGTWNGSNINVGGNTNLTSNNNLNVEGSNIDTAGQLALNAKNINITAGTNTDKESTESRSEGGGISVSMQPTTTSYSGSVNASQNRSDYQSTDYVNSQIGAGSLVSNSDNLTIKGGNVSADTIDITTGSLTVESLQNTSSGSSTSVGLNLSASLGGSDKGWEGKNEDPTKSPAASGVTGFGGNASKGNSEKAWVAQQSGITGGTVNITAKDTTLTGAAIAAVDEQGQTTDKLTLTTGTLTVADIKDTDTSQNIGLGYSVSGLATGETPPDNTDPGAKDAMDPSQSTYSASFNGHDKQQTNKATVGLGNVSVGGTSIDQQPEFAGLNRDAANSQETTKDIERGGVDISLTVDNRMLSEAGWEDIAEDVEKTNTAVVDGVDYVADEIAVMGDNLPEELRDTLGQTGEAFVDELIRADLPDDQIEALLQSDDIKTGLANINDATNKLSQNPDVKLGEFSLTYPVDTSPAVNVVGETTTPGSEDESSSITYFSDNAEPTALQVGTAGLGKVQQKIDQLEQENPAAAQAVNYAINLATGGPLKTAIGEAISYGVNQMAGDMIQNISDTATSYIGAIVQEKSVPTFDKMLASERENTDQNAPLGTSAVDTVDGLRLGSVIAGVGGLIKVVKKGSSSSDSSTTGTSETSEGEFREKVTSNIARTDSENSDSVKLLSPPKTANVWRNSPGRSYASSELREIKDGDKWLRGSAGNAGTVPKQIADKLAGQQFNNFDEFRSHFWKEVSNDPVLQQNFNSLNVKRMSEGKAPYAESTQQVGGRKVYELDHNHEIQNGGNVYDFSNIIIRTPLNHIKGK